MNSLDPRKQRILQAVVREHILHAEPVGSRLLAGHYLPDVSSATVRNDMSALEDLGYLIQPHTSAGRVPTERGYRYYVNSIMGIDQLTGREERIVKSRLDALNRQVEEVLQDVSFILSRLTNLMAVTVAQKAPRRSVRRVDLVPMTLRSMLVVVVTSDGEVERAKLEMDENLDEQRVMGLEQLLNETATGISAAELRAVLPQIGAQAARIWGAESMTHLCRRVGEAILDVLGRAGEGKIFLDGANYMLGQPEFSQAEKALAVFLALEERNRVLELIREVVNTQHVVIKIGSDLASLSAECSFVGASYRMAGGTTGVLGILGPVRMNYARAAAAVSAVTAELSEII